jgi:hypothetical protein
LPPSWSCSSRSARKLQVLQNSSRCSCPCKPGSQGVGAGVRVGVRHACPVPCSTRTYCGATTPGRESDARRWGSRPISRSPQQGSRSRRRPASAPAATGRCWTRCGCARPGPPGYIPGPAGTPRQPPTAGSHRPGRAGAAPRPAAASCRCGPARPPSRSRAAGAGRCGCAPIGRRPGVLVAEEPRLHARQVRDPSRGGSLAQPLQHRWGDVDGDDLPEPAGGGQGEPARPGTQVHHRRSGIQAMGDQHGQVLSRVGIALLALIAGHESQVEMLRARMGQLVQHPHLGHGRCSLLGERLEPGQVPALCGDHLGPDQ